jgi:hypothetical protein
MKTSIALVYIVVFFVFGFGHGFVYRHVCYWKRAGFYIRNDEYRIGVFALSLVFVLYFVRIGESSLVFHATLREGLWPLAWSIMYCWGIVAGFARSFVKQDPSIIELQKVCKDMTISPITEMPDE